MIEFKKPVPSGETTAMSVNNHKVIIMICISISNIA